MASKFITLKLFHRSFTDFPVHLCSALNHSTWVFPVSSPTLDVQLSSTKYTVQRTFTIFTLGGYALLLVLAAMTSICIGLFLFVIITGKLSSPVARAVLNLFRANTGFVTHRDTRYFLINNGIPAWGLFRSKTQTSCAKKYFVPRRLLDLVRGKQGDIARSPRTNSKARI